MPLRNILGGISCACFFLASAFIGHAFRRLDLLTPHEFYIILLVLLIPGIGAGLAYLRLRLSVPAPKVDWVRRSIGWISIHAGGFLLGADQAVGFLLIVAGGVLLGSPRPPRDDGSPKLKDLKETTPSADPPVTP